MMKPKKILLMVALTVLVISAPFIYLSGAAQSVSVSFNPSVVSGLAVGSTFTISLQVSGVTNLWGWALSLSWDPSILQMPTQNQVTEGPFLKSVGSTLFVPVPANNTLGVLETVSDILLQNVGASGNGYLANFTFTVVKSGTCQINVTSSEFDSIDSNGNTAIIPVTVSNVTFTTMADPVNSAYGPKANFTPVDGSIYVLGSPVILNATSSQPGYDTQTCNITNYAWSVEYPNGTTFTSLTGETATFNASVEGAFRIILIITANDTQSSPNVNYTATDSTSATVYIVPNPEGTKIDVFTDKGGVGSNATSGQYSPLQTLLMYASVTSDNVSLSNQNVLFTVQNSNGSVIAVRQGVTNGTGIALAQFRLPSPDPNSPQTNFGTWSVTAAVNVLGTTVNDTTAFVFSYSCYLSGVQKVQMPASVHRLETFPIQLTVNSSYYPAQWTQLSITVFDQAGIPIGSSTVSTSQTKTITVMSSDIVIPSWAFTGQATVYICLLTNSSSSRAVPLSPETVATFNITA